MTRYLRYSVYYKFLNYILGELPYSCRICSIEPTSDDPTEEMILHYGCDEQMSAKFYAEDCKRLETPNVYENNATNRYYMCTFFPLKVNLIIVQFM